MLGIGRLEVNWSLPAGPWTLARECDPGEAGRHQTREKAVTESPRTPVVIVGVDGSDDSVAAVRWAQQYAVSTGATIRLVTAWEWPQLYGAAFASYDGFNPADDARAVAEKAAAELSIPGDRVNISVVEGLAREVLVSAAEGGDLLVVGSHGHTTVGGLLLGSVSAYCVHHATAPVVVVR
jgi:nucleotide-binding universal stress UspA family protein